MKATTKTTAALAALALAVSGALALASPALADDAAQPAAQNQEVAPSPDTPDPSATPTNPSPLPPDGASDTSSTTTNESTSDTPAPASSADPSPSTEPTTAPAQSPSASVSPVSHPAALVEPVDPTPYVLVAWSMVDASNPAWPQTIYAHKDVSDATLAELDSQLTGCGLNFQIDLYLDDQTTASLIAGGHLDGPNNPTEHLASGAQGLSGNPWKFVNNDACPPPPTEKVCQSTTDAGTATDADHAGWVSVDTRSAGHAEFVPGGLHVYTDDATSNAKVSWGHALTGSLADLGDVALDYTAANGVAPGLNVYVTFESGKTGTLVWESVYGGSDWWLTGGSSASIIAPETGGGFGSNRHGTLNEWLAAYPGATVTGFAFSLGSGVFADGVIHSITVDCQTYHFDRSPEPVAVVTVVDDHDSKDCDATEITHVHTTSTVSYSWLGGVWVAGQPVLNTVTTERATTAEDCPPVVVPPTEPPSTPPVVVVPPTQPTVIAEPTEQTLAHTGSDTTDLGPIFWGAMSFALLGIVLCLLALRRTRIVRAKDARLDAIEAGEITPFD